MKVISSFLIGMVLISSSAVAAKKSKEPATQIVTLECPLDNISPTAVFTINLSTKTATAELFANGGLYETYDFKSMEIDPTTFRIHYTGKGYPTRPDSYMEYQMTINRVTGDWEEFKAFFADKTTSLADTKTDTKKSTASNQCHKANANIKTKF